MKLLPGCRPQQGGLLHPADQQQRLGVQDSCVFLGPEPYALPAPSSMHVAAKSRRINMACAVTA